MLLIHAKSGSFVQMCRKVITFEYIRSYMVIKPSTELLVRLLELLSVDLQLFQVETLGVSLTTQLCQVTSTLHHLFLVSCQLVEQKPRSSRIKYPLPGLGNVKPPSVTQAVTTLICSFTQNLFYPGVYSSS